MTGDEGVDSNHEHEQGDDSVPPWLPDRGHGERGTPEERHRADAGGYLAEDRGDFGQGYDPGPYQPALIEAQSFHVAPLPSPDHFEAYQRIDPRINDVVLDIASKTVDAETYVAKSQVRAESFATIVGALTAWVAPAMCLIGAIILTALGASGIVVGTIGAIGGLIVVAPRVIAAAKGRPERD